MMFEYEEDLPQPQEAVESKTHTFKTRIFRNPHSCGFCKEIIWNEGRICRVCRFACHKRCEYKVRATNFHSASFFSSQQMAKK
nr:uncharacterized protein LOC129279828 [Lytechinus pictus]